MYLHRLKIIISLMMNKLWNGWLMKKILFIMFKILTKTGFSDFQFISSWSTNYKSWKVQKKVPIKLIKYEDLLNKTYEVFFEIIEFINKTINNNEKIDKIKLKNTLKSTTFDTLKKKEMQKGFSEAVTTNKDAEKKISFFHLGPKNDWRKMLNEELKLKLNKAFEKDLKELSYL